MIEQKRPYTDFEGHQEKACAVVQRECGVSHEVRQGALGASHVAPGKSGLHVRGEGEGVIALEPW